MGELCTLNQGNPPRNVWRVKKGQITGNHNLLDAVHYSDNAYFYVHEGIKRCLALIKPVKKH